MKNWWKGVQAEFSSRIGSSIKRAIKFFGVSIIPIIYAVTCIVAFWNPIPNIGKAKVGFLDGDSSYYIATKNVDLSPYTDVKPDKTHEGDLKGGKSEKQQMFDYSEVNKFDTEILKGAMGLVKIDGNTLTEEYVKEKQIDFTNPETLKNLTADNNIEVSSDKVKIFKISAWNIFKSLLIENNTPTSEDDGTVFSTKEISDEKIAFTNIRHVNKKQIQDTYKNDYSYYVQFKIDEGFLIPYIELMSRIVDGRLLEGIGNIVTDLKPIEFKPMDIWTTFERNFLFGYYLKTLNQFKEAIPIKIVSKLMDDIKEGTSIISTIMNELSKHYPKSEDIMNVQIDGIDNAVYGIGLGEFFLLIGLYVGTIVHTFVYDRAKRVTKLTHTQYYLSKTMLMWVTGLVQATLLILAVTAAGWHQLGAERLVLLWLWLMFAETAFVITVQAFWFALKDETIGKFLVIIYMVMNLSAGWGTFPAFMQFGFFHSISYVTEYTYILHGIGAIIYGTPGSANTLYIFTQAGILLLFMAVFMAFGLYVSKNRTKEMHYGSYIAKYVAECLEVTGRTELLKEFRIEKENSKTGKVKYKYNWKALPMDAVYDDVVEKMRELHPFEGQFKRFKNKPHDRILKPNYSDDDIMSRSDEVTV